MVLDHDVLRFANRAKREQTAARHVRDANLFSALAAFSERRQTAKNDGTGFPHIILTTHRLELSFLGQVLLGLRLQAKPSPVAPHESHAISYKAGSAGHVVGMNQKL